jgi:hypothetical protein
MAADGSDEPSFDASAEGSSDASVSPASDAASDRSVDASADIGANDEPQVQKSCYVRPSITEPVSPVSECAPAGQKGAGIACEDSSECDATLACVVVDGKPVCRKFSCALPPSCPAGSYYQLESLRVAGATVTDLKVPVCLPVDQCLLTATPNPCPSARVCAVVGSEGDTTCIVPGTAKLGDPCDDLHFCAEGLVCSKLKNQCLKLCRVAAGNTECPGGTCQGGNRSLPDGIGICVGTSPDAG